MGVKQWAVSHDLPASAREDGSGQRAGRLWLKARHHPRFCAIGSQPASSATSIKSADQADQVLAGRRLTRPGHVELHNAWPAYDINPHAGTGFISESIRMEQAEISRRVHAWIRKAIDEAISE